MQTPDCLFFSALKINQIAFIAFILGAGSVMGSFYSVDKFSWKCKSKRILKSSQKFV
jgi:hypothetical protein